MQIPEKITVPKYPKFMFAPDPRSMELYIICNNPLALIWVRQTIPAQLYIVEGKQDPIMIRQAGEWYRENSQTKIDKN